MEELEAEKGLEWHPFLRYEKKFSKRKWKNTFNNPQTGLTMTKKDYTKEPEARKPGKRIG